MHAYLVIPDKTTQKNVVKILAEHIVFQEKPQLTMIDKMISLLSRLIPDDEEEENVPATIQVDRKDGEVAHGLGDIKDTLASFFQRPEKTSLSPQSSEPKI